MTVTATILLILGLAGILFGAWGQYTDAGRARYDEMAGMIPYFAWWAGIILLSISIILWIAIAMKR